MTMSYEVVLEGHSLTFRIHDAAGGPGVSIGGREVACDWLRLPDGRYSIILDGRVFDLSVEKYEEARIVSGREGCFRIGVVDPRQLTISQSSDTGRSGVQRVCAELPGRIVRVLVRPGDAVTADQGLLVIEAMKMQNEIRAPGIGIVREVAAREGTTVSTGEFLLSIG